MRGFTQTKVSSLVLVSALMSSTLCACAKLLGVEDLPELPDEIPDASPGAALDAIPPGEFGGGGHFTTGVPGGGDPSNPGGIVTGRPGMVPLASEQGHGGGGIVELTSYGTFTITPNGSIVADGGKGSDGLCTGAINNGSGGGGSGGGILGRAWGGFDDQSDAAALSVRGGDGGALGPDTDCPNIGGAGSAGRIRVDTSDLGGLPFFARAQPTPFQGPLIRNRNNGGNPIRVVVSQAMLTLDAMGEPDHELFLDVNGARRDSFLHIGRGRGQRADPAPDRRQSHLRSHGPDHVARGQRGRAVHRDRVHAVRRVPRRRCSTRENG